MAKTHVALVLDQSGSMGTTLVETISGFNEQLDTLREMRSVDHEIGVTFTVFGTKVTTHFVDKPIEEVRNISEETYQPKGWTALYDAVGTTIIALEDTVDSDPEDAYLVMVFSDGKENQSKEYTSDSLASVINRLKGTGKWTFTYLGSNQDLSKVVETLGVSVGNVCNYSSDSAGTLTAYAAQSRATKRYFAARFVGEACCDSLYSSDGCIADAEDVVAQADSK
jgi:uncharacterized protein YegL